MLKKVTRFGLSLPHTVQLYPSNIITHTACVLAYCMLHTYLLRPRLELIMDSTSAHRMSKDDLPISCPFQWQEIKWRLSESTRWTVAPAWPTSWPLVFIQSAHRHRQPASLALSNSLLCMHLHCRLTRGLRTHHHTTPQCCSCTQRLAPVCAARGSPPGELESVQTQPAIRSGCTGQYIMVISA